MVIEPPIIETRIVEPRRRAREVVLQILYADDMNPQRNQREVADFLRNRLLNDPEMVAKAEGLLSGVRHKREELDAHLQSLSDHWSLTRMSATDRNVLRMGAYEILHADTPRPVAINEALELARRYGTRSSPHFVNGVLGKIINEEKERLMAELKEKEKQAEKERLKEEKERLQAEAKEKAAAELPAGAPQPEAPPAGVQQPAEPQAELQTKAPEPGQEPEQA